MRRESKSCQSRADLRAVAFIKDKKNFRRELVAEAANPTGFAVLPGRAGRNNLATDEVAQAPRQGKFEREFS